MILGVDLVQVRFRYDVDVSMGATADLSDVIVSFYNVFGIGTRVSQYRFLDTLRFSVRKDLRELDPSKRDEISFLMIFSWRY